MIHEAGENMWLPAPEQGDKPLEGLPVRATPLHLQAHDREPAADSFPAHLAQRCHRDDADVISVGDERLGQVDDLPVGAPMPRLVERSRTRRVMTDPGVQALSMTCR